MIQWLKRLWSAGRGRVGPLSEWYFVDWDDREVRIRASPPVGEAWEDGFVWEDVVRVCFKAEDLYLSDGIYVFTDRRPESYVVPTEAEGGSAFWEEILRRDLFDAELAIEAAGSAEGLFCWPKE